MSIAAGALAGLILAGSFVLTLLKVEPISIFFYMIAWWCYIVVIGAVNHRKGGNSLLFDRPRRLFRLALFSIPIWFFFEAYNLRLGNWHYFGVPFDPRIRWPGYLISFATVIPGIFETATLLKNYEFPKPLRARGLRLSRGLLIRFFLIGALMMVAPLISPQLFYPTVWLGWIFLLSSALYRHGLEERSLLGDVEKGDYTRIVRLMAAGLLCGILWEFWNYWAASKWIYTIPYLDFLRIFEMPLLGYLGFPFFALECYLLVQALELFWEGVACRSRGLQLFILLLMVAFVGFVIREMDAHTVVGFKLVF